MKYILILIFAMPFYGAQSQVHNSRSQSSVGFSLGGNFSQVRFKNSDGLLDEDLKGISGTSATLFYFSQLSNRRKKRDTSANLVGVELGFKSSKFQDTGSNLLSTWDMQFLTVQATFRHVTLTNSRVNLFFGGGLVVDYLSRGTQNQGFSQFDITEDLNRVNLSITVETGIKYEISNDSYTTLRLGYLRGLSNLEKDQGQQVFIHAIRLSAAVYFYLGNSKKF